MIHPPTTRRKICAMSPGACAAAVTCGAVLAFASPAHAVDTSATEGDTMTFTVTLGAAPNGWAVRYKYSTEDQSAYASDDYASTSGTVTFASGQKERTVAVDTIDDTAAEPSEVFKLKLYDQEVNGLYRGVTGWVTPTSGIRSMPSTMTLTGRIMDNDASSDSATPAAGGT